MNAASVVHDFAAAPGQPEDHRFPALAGTVSAAAAAPAATPATAGSTTLTFSVHFSPFEALHLNPHPDPNTGFGFGDELTFHDQLFAHTQRAGDEGGSCVVVDGSQPLANCTEVIRLKQGTITAAGLNGPPPTKHFAITGGTGLYRTAGGQTTLIEFGSTRGKLTIHLLGFLTRRMKPHARPGHPSRARTGPGSMPNAVGTTARQNCMFRAAPAAMSNDRDWRQIGGSACVLLDLLYHSV